MKLFKFSIIVILLSIVCFCEASIPTAAGEVTWTRESNYIKDVSLVRGTDILHADGYDNAFMYSYTTDVYFDRVVNYYYSTTYAMVIQEVIFSNNSGSAGFGDFRSSGNLGSDSATKWHYKVDSGGPFYSISSDNTEADENATDVVVSFLWGDETAAQYGTEFSASDGDDEYYFMIGRYDLENNETRRFLFIGGVGDIDDGDYNRPDKALEAVTQLCEPVNWPKDLLDEFTETEFEQVLNWDMSPVMVPPTISCDTIYLEGTTAMCNGISSSSTSYTRGIYYSTEEGFDVSTAHSEEDVNTDSDYFGLEMTDLVLGTRYYYRFYATNIFGTTLTEEGSFVADYSTPYEGMLGIIVSVGAAYDSRLDFNWEMKTGYSSAVFVKQTSDGAADPIDNNTYNADQDFGNGAEAGSGWYCVYNGQDETAVVTGLTELTDYRIMVVTYNGIEGYEKYLVQSSEQNPINVSTNSTPAPVEVPTSVEISKFGATDSNGSVELKWETCSETENCGFILYRDGEMISSYLMNASLCGQGSSSLSAEYCYRDDSVEPGITYEYILGDIDFSGKETRHTELRQEIRVLSVDGVGCDDFLLQQIYPNPFNSRFTISFKLKQMTDLQIALYDIKGHLLRILLDSHYAAGSYEISTDTQELTSGLYVVRINTADSMMSKKLLLLK